MRYRELGRPGRPGLRVSEIGLESREIGGTVWIDGPSGSSRPYGYGVADDDESLRMISRARALGINFILTSPTFGIGHAERLIGQAINGDRDYWVLGLMGGLAIDGTRLVRDISYESLTANLQASLGRLGTSDADLFLIESVTEAELRDGSCIDSLKRIGISGATGFIGVDVDLATVDVELLLGLDVDVVRIRYNMFEPVAGDFFARAKSAGLGIIAKGVLAEGFLAGNFTGPDSFAEDDERSLIDVDRADELITKSANLLFLEAPQRSLAQASLLYVLANQAVSVALTGAATVDEIEEDAMAGSLPRLDEEALDRIGRLQRSNFQPL